MEAAHPVFNAVFLGKQMYSGHSAILQTRMAANPNISLSVFHTFEAFQSSPIYGQVHILLLLFTTTDEFLQILHDNPIQWVHSYTVGVDKYLVSEFVSSPIPLTNARGLYSQSLAEYAFCALLRFAKKFPLLETQQAAKQWAYMTSGHFSKMTMVVLGFGDIGRAVARIAKLGFGIKVIGVRKHPQPDELADEVCGIEKLHQVLPMADILVMCLPSLPCLTHVISSRELSLLKRSSILVNLGRGVHLDESALIQALHTGHLAGAALDVFDTEPLPADSLLWQCENLMISPHNADHLIENHEKTAVAFDQNLSLFLQGRLNESPSLVHKEQGY